jgi:hypothetical protein
MATQFGMFLHSIEDAAGNARRLEALGYDYVGCGEHVSFCDHTSNSVTSLAAAARATSHIRLASAIVLLPRYPAALPGRAGRPRWPGGGVFRLAPRHRTRPSPAAFGVDLSRSGRGEAAREPGRAWIFASPSPGEAGREAG